MLDTIERDACRIYVADLAAYNAGRLRGEWIDLDGKEESDVWNAINAMLANSPESNVTRRKCEDCGHYQDARRVDQGEQIEPADCNECGGPLSAPFPSAEEWAVHDHEGFAGMLRGENPDIGELCQLAEFLDGAEEDTRLGLLWLVNDRELSVSDALEQAADVRIHRADVFDLAGDYAQELFEEMGTADERHRLNQWPFTCIDWEAAGKELEMGGDVDTTTHDGVRFLVTNASEF